MLRAILTLSVLSLGQGCTSSDPDEESPTDFDLQIRVSSADEGAQRIDSVATLRLNRPAQTAVEVIVTTSDSARLQPVESVVRIESGQTEGDVGLLVVDNTTVGRDATYTVSVDTLGHSESFDFAVADDESHALVLDGPSSAIEGSGPSSLTLRATGDLEESVSVVLDAQPAGVLQLPAQITLDAGRSSWQIDAVMPDDALLNFDRPVTITALPEDFLEAPEPFTITVEDDEPATLTLSADATNLSEADGMIIDGARLVLGAPVAIATTVSLQSSDPQVLLVPPQVTVPALSDEAAIDLTPINNDTFDGDATVTLTASGVGLSSDTLSVTVADDDVPNLQLTVQSTSVSEGDGVLAGWGTVSLGVISSTDQTLTLTSSDETELTVPETVTIPAGTESVSFAVGVEDDEWLDFASTVTLTASANDWFDEVQMSVADDESNQLTVLVDDIEVWEDSGQIFDSVHVHTAAPVEAPLQVDLASSDETEIQVQLQVTIPAGETSTPVDIYVSSGQDDVPDQDKTVEITATADGCTAGSAQVTVQDLDSGYVVELLQSEGVEHWVSFPGLPGLMHDSDWAFAMRLMIPEGADTFGYNFFRGQAFEDLAGDFSVELKLTDPQASLLFLGLSMNAGTNGVTLTEGTWHDIVVQYDLASTTLYLYIDGTLVDDHISAPKDDRDNLNRMVWGGQYNELYPEAGEVYNESDTTFAHMGVWQRKLTPQEIAGYHGDPDVDDPDIVFSTAIGPNAVYDLVGSNNGTVHGNPTFYVPQ